MAQKAKITMDELLANEEVTPIALGDTIDGIVMSVKKHEILIDLGARGVGMVPRREVAFGRQLKVGDEVSASVVDTEMEDGMVLLSLRKAVKRRAGTRFLPSLTLVKLSRFNHTTLTVAVCWLNMKVFVASCQFLSFRQSTTHA